MEPSCQTTFSGPPRADSDPVSVQQEPLSAIRRSTVEGPRPAHDTGRMHAVNRYPVACPSSGNHHSSDTEHHPTEVAGHPFE